MAIDKCDEPFGVSTIRIAKSPHKSLWIMVNGFDGLYVEFGKYVRWWFASSQLSRWNSIDVLFKKMDGSTRFKYWKLGAYPF